MLTRTISDPLCSGATTDNLGYDVENRMTGVTAGGVNASLTPKCGPTQLQ
jgi:hypothetical protein